MNKKSLSETDICAKFITPAVIQAGWDEAMQIRREVGFTKGRIIVRGKLVTRGKAKRADGAPGGDGLVEERCGLGGRELLQ